MKYLYKYPQKAYPYDDLVRGKIVVINFMFATCNGT